jgi:hypothetical protein
MPTQEVLDYGSTSPRSAGKGFRLGDTCGLQLDKGDAAELMQDRHRVAAD